MPVRIRVGDRVRLKKMHPCGSYEWEVVRVGADIGIRCMRCRHRVFIKRSVFERRVRDLTSAAQRESGEGA
jgi:hypothetical protein